MSEDLDAKAEEVLLRMTRARRRARPRVAEAFYDAQDAQIETGFGVVQAWRLGEGPAVLLVHGWEDDNALWGPLIDRFAEIGRAVVAFDLPGHGYSPAEEASIYSASEAVMAVAQACGPVDALVAHSFGCPASGRAIELGLHIDRAVLIATPVWRAQGHGKRTLVDRGGVDPGVFDRAMALYERRTGRPYAGFEFSNAAHMTIPALFVHSSDDEQCSCEAAIEFAATWPRAETLIVDDLGHRLVAQDEGVLGAVVDYIEGR